MERKAKMGMSALMIVAITFSAIGVVFLPVGIASFILNFSVEGSLIIFSMVFGIMGSVFLALGLLFFFIEMKKRNTCNRLLREGYCITGEVVSIDRNFAVQYGKHGHPYIVRCKYEDYNGTTHIFKSRNISSYPGNISVGTMVRIYLDRNEPDHYKNYYMDIDEVLGNVIEH